MELFDDQDVLDTLVDVRSSHSYQSIIWLVFETGFADFVTRVRVSRLSSNELQR